MKTMEQIESGLWDIADALRSSFPSNVVAECPPLFFFLKRFTDLGNAVKLNSLTPQLDIGKIYFFKDFSWSSIIKSQSPQKELRTLIIKIEASTPQLAGLADYTSFSQLLDERNGTKELLTIALSILENLPVGKLTQGEAANQFQQLVDRMADRAGNSVTPPSVRSLLVSLVCPSNGESVYDPVCGFASLLCEANKRAAGLRLAGQELNRGTLLLGQMNVLLSGGNADLRPGDTLVLPQHVLDRDLKQFDVILANPPFGVRLDPKSIESDPFGRYSPDIPSSSELAFVQHVLHTMTPQGRAAILVPNGILSRAGRDYAIRKRLVETNRLQAVIGLPRHLIPGTPIAVSVLVLRGEHSAKSAKPILFASLSSFAQGPVTHRSLNAEGLELANTLLQQNCSQNGISQIATPTQVEANDFDLSVCRYVETPRNTDLLPLEDELKRLEVCIEERNLAERTALELMKALNNSGSN